MALYDFSSPRLFVQAALREAEPVMLDRNQANYLLNVLRLAAGREVLLFNGRDGEWRAPLAAEGRRDATLRPVERMREQPPEPDLHYLFAPLKHARTDYMVEKAVEMGAGLLQPVFTHRTAATRVNRDRMRSNAIEAAEQCGILHVPAVAPEDRFEAALRRLAPERLLVFCDEDAPIADPVAALRERAAGAGGTALLIGPEGGFAPEERALLLSRPNVVRLSLGPRILRADTAAIAALAILQAAIGDWRPAP